MSTSTEWQEPQLLDLAHDVVAAFLAIIESVPAGRTFTVNDVRDRLDAADVPAVKRGVLFSLACRRELIEPVRLTAWGRETDVYVPSTGTSAHRATVRLYRRLKPTPAPAPAPAHELAAVS